MISVVRISRIIPYILILSIHIKTNLISNVLATEFKNVAKVVTSVWCRKTDYNFKCVFTNLCYNSVEDFLFLLSNESVLFGLKDREDLMVLQASPVLNNSAFFIKINIIDDDFVYNAIFIDSPVFVLYRFKPDNIMHVIHDDLLPLFATYKEICFGNITKCVTNIRLAFIDNYVSKTFIDWYSALSHGEPLHLPSLDPEYTYCFSEIHVGLSLQTIFYQYGYEDVRGAFTNKNFNGILLSEYSRYMLEYFKINEKPGINKITFISRKINRKILNENYLEKIIFNIKNKNHFEFTILNIDISVNSTIEILSAISTSYCLLGIHGSGMILSIFLPKNSNVVELFPYGIKKETVSPIYSLSKMSNINFNYFSWENSKKYLSFPHPEYPALHGGIKFFSKLKKVEIIIGLNLDSSINRCCHNPKFLYNMYYDTIVDDTIIPVLESALKNKETIKERKNVHFKSWFFPSNVRNITCIFKNKILSVSWSPPLNVKLDYKCVYHLTAATVYQNISFSTSSNFLYYNMDFITFENNKNIQIWIVCKCEGIIGRETYHYCL